MSSWKTILSKLSVDTLLFGPKDESNLPHFFKVHS